MAKPLPIALLALDPPATAAKALESVHITAPVFADDRPPAAVLAEWAGAGTSLPLALAIDRQGHICGIKRGLLGTDQLHQWAQTCSQ